MTDQSVADDAEPGGPRKFLADPGDDDFDFQQWYEQQLDDFKTDQDNVDYDSDKDRSDDEDDFRQRLGDA